MYKYIVISLLFINYSSISSASWFENAENWVKSMLGYQKVILPLDITSMSPEEIEMRRKALNSNDYYSSLIQRRTFIYMNIKNNEVDLFLRYRNKYLEKFPEIDILEIFSFGMPFTRFGLGTTPLHIAAYFESKDFLRYLLQLISRQWWPKDVQDAWINAEINGFTALDLAERSIHMPLQNVNNITNDNDDSCVALLRSNGARRGSLAERQLENVGGVLGALRLIDME